MKQLRFALAQTQAPVRWFGSRHLGARLIFLFAVPEHAAADYLQVISGLARFTRLPSRVQELVACTDPKQILRLLEQVRLPAPQPVGTTASF